MPEGLEDLRAFLQKELMCGRQAARRNNETTPSYSEQRRGRNTCDKGSTATTNERPTAITGTHIDSQTGFCRSVRLQQS
jgi:hypothetical protein